MLLGEDLYASCVCLNADWYESNLERVVSKLRLHSGGGGE